MNNVVITKENFDVGEQYEALRNETSKSGAVVFFVGLVRDFYDDVDGEKITHLQLHHYPGMTERLCEEIIEQAKTRYPFEKARVIHRVGDIAATEQIVMVAVASQHRDNAFQAAQFIMDYLKTKATFWKKEMGQRGEQWVEQKDKVLSALDLSLIYI